MLRLNNDTFISQSFHHVTFIYSMHIFRAGDYNFVKSSMWWYNIPKFCKSDDKLNIYDASISLLTIFLPARCMFVNFCLLHLTLKANSLYSIILEDIESNNLKSLKVAKWRKDEWRMKNDEGWRFYYEGWWFLAVEGFLFMTDERTNKRTEKNDHSSGAWRRCSWNAW